MSTFTSLKNFCFILACLGVETGCATTPLKVGGNHVLAGKVGVVSSFPAHFRSVASSDSYGLEFVSLEVPAMLALTDIPIPLEEARGDEAHKILMNAYVTDIEKVAVDGSVSAETLFWRPDEQTGAFEISYSFSAKLGEETPVPKLLRVLHVSTRKGRRSVRLLKNGKVTEKFISTWQDIVDQLCIEKEAAFSPQADASPCPEGTLPPLDKLRLAS